ncbi:MAG TPA: DUF6191 domain-containing protein [Pseudonocardiaceae bacterium]|jgi:hypothetical protein|nr:DUF6191 domain-containing protein [Pseudonocardiaceae bacterium]
MALALAFSLPAGVLLLVIVGAYETKRRRRRPGPTLSATYLDEVTAVLYGTKRQELDHRNSWSMLRAEDAQGAPPRLGVDLEHGIVRLPPD